MLKKKHIKYVEEQGPDCMRKSRTRGLMLRFYGFIIINSIKRTSFSLKKKKNLTKEKKNSKLFFINFFF